MRWCNAQINEYDLQAETYPTIYIHHKLHNNDNENKFSVFPEFICNTSQAHGQGKNRITMGKVDTSDVMMIITWAIDIYHDIRHVEIYRVTQGLRAAIAALGVDNIKLEISNSSRALLIENVRNLTQVWT